MKLVLCVECNQHVRSVDVACPFCGASVHVTGVDAIVVTQRLSRAAILAGAAAGALALGVSSCGGMPMYGCSPCAEDASVVPNDAGVKTDASTSDASTDAPSLDASSDVEIPVQLDLKCAEGDQCEAGAPTCCATLSFGADCVLDTVASTCTTTSACPTTLQPFCATTETVHLCAQNADCTEPDYPQCCTFDITGHSTSLVMCANEAMAEAADASCVP